MVFGIGTQANNGIGSATVSTSTPTRATWSRSQRADLRRQLHRQRQQRSLFGTRAFAICSKPLDGFYCPATTQNASATIQGTNGASSPVNFSIANASQLATANPTYFAFSNLGGINPDSLGFAWGLPFHYGRNVATAIEGRSTPAGTDLTSLLKRREKSARSSLSAAKSLASCAFARAQRAPRRG